MINCFKCNNRCRTCGRDLSPNPYNYTLCKVCYEKPKHVDLNFSASDFSHLTDALEKYNKENNKNITMRDFLENFILKNVIEFNKAK